MAWQGMVWHAGFEAGDLVAEMFPDVVPAMQQWAFSGEPWDFPAELNRIKFARQGLHLSLGSGRCMPAPEQHVAPSDHARQACVTICCRALRLLLERPT